MPGATIVYDGGGGGGDLFAGLKFYIMQRVPSRDKWKDLIVSNGGECVLAEKHSNIIIADHARANQPVGSISWKFIEDSVKHGRLEDQEDHLAGPAAKVVREVGAGSTQPVRAGRVPFSAEDDKVLMQWCTKAERSGVSVKGNVLFQQLERKNPRHTAQSWRDRWVKKLFQMPRHALDEMEEEEDEDEEKGNEEVLPPPVRTQAPSPRDMPNRPKNTSTSVTSKPTQPIKKEPARTASGARSSVQGTNRGVPKVPAPKSNLRVEIPIKSSKKSSAPARSSPKPASSPQVMEPLDDVFSEEETEKLVELHDDILTVRPDRTIDFWIQWSKENPEHTAQEWFNHFSEYVQPMMIKVRAKKGKFREVSSPVQVEMKASKPSSSKSNPNPVNKRIKEVKDSQEQHSTQNSKKLSSQKSTVPYASDEAAFTDDLLQLAERVKLDVELNTVIGGRSISMFDLWVVVMANQFGGFQNVINGNLWPKVATRLGFNLKKQPQALEELVAYFQEYEELLADFEELARDEDEEEAGEELDRNDSSLLADQLLEMVEHNTDPVDSEEEDDADIAEQEEPEDEDNINSSQVSTYQKQRNSGSRKRVAAGSSPNTKRQRIDKGKGKALEIPSTPEDIKSPQTARLALKSSPLKNTSSPGTDGSHEEYSEEEEGLFVPGSGQNIKPPPRLQNMEPETQDFQFPASSPLKSDSHLSSSPPPRLKLTQQSQTSNAATRGTAHSSSLNDSSTQSQTQSQIQAIIDKCIADLTDKGFTQDIVLQALQATTLKVNGNVETVAESLMMEKGVPDNIRGVWTEWDDEELGFGVESKQYRHVLLKHGAEEIKERKRFLREMAE